jgi:hypothetical protein
VLAPRIRFAPCVSAILACTALLADAPAQAEVRANGPLAAVGFAEKFNDDMVLPTLGWRWQLGPGATIEEWGKRIGADFSFIIEPSLAAVVGDKDSFETQIVPYFHAEPSAMREEWSPYFEGGIGIIYTALEGLRLGSNVLFSNNVGAGVAFAVRKLGPWTRLSVGYRFRHISHAGIFGEPNSGLNTHYLTIGLQ